LAIKTLVKAVSDNIIDWGNDELFRVVSYVTIEAGENTSGNSIWEFNKDSLLIGLCKFAL
jgi:hypothetical protein